jgi:hypothetical protein
MSFSTQVARFLERNPPRYVLSPRILQQIDAHALASVGAHLRGRLATEVGLRYCMKTRHARHSPRRGPVVRWSILEPIMTRIAQREG